MTRVTPLAAVGVPIAASCSASESTWPRSVTTVPSSSIAMRLASRWAWRANAGLAAAVGAAQRHEVP